MLIFHLDAPFCAEMLMGTHKFKVNVPAADHEEAARILFETLYEIADHMGAESRIELNQTISLNDFKEKILERFESALDHAYEDCQCGACY